MPLFCWGVIVQWSDDALKFSDSLIALLVQRISMYIVEERRLKWFEFFVDFTNKGQNVRHDGLESAIVVDHEHIGGVSRDGRQLGLFSGTNTDGDDSDCFVYTQFLNDGLQGSWRVSRPTWILFRLVQL